MLILIVRKISNKDRNKFIYLSRKKSIFQADSNLVLYLKKEELTGRFVSTIRHELLNFLFAY